jgi:hypothetical protein
MKTAEPYAHFPTRQELIAMVRELEPVTREDIRNCLNSTKNRMYNIRPLPGDVWAGSVPDAQRAKLSAMNMIDRLEHMKKLAKLCEEALENWVDKGERYGN